MNVQHITLEHPLAMAVLAHCGAKLQCAKLIEVPTLNEKLKESLIDFEPEKHAKYVVDDVTLLNSTEKLTMHCIQWDDGLLLEIITNVPMVPSGLEAIMFNLSLDWSAMTGTPELDTGTDIKPSPQHHTESKTISIQEPVKSHGDTFQEHLEYFNRQPRGMTSPECYVPDTNFPVYSFEHGQLLPNNITYNSATKSYYKYTYVHHEGIVPAEKELVATMDVEINPNSSKILRGWTLDELKAIVNHLTMVQSAVKVNNVYRHSKSGTLYVVVDVGTRLDADSGEALIDYREHGNPQAQVWTHRLSQFTKTNDDGTPRFELMDK